MNRKDRRHQSRRPAKGTPPAGTTLPEAVQHLIALYEAGRFTAAVHREMGIEDLIAGDHADHVERAVARG